METFEISPFVAWQIEASTNTMYLMDTRNEEIYFLEDEVSKTILEYGSDYGPSPTSCNKAKIRKELRETA